MTPGHSLLYSLLTLATCLMTVNTRLSAEREPQNPKQWQCGVPSEYQRSPKRDLDPDGKPLEKVYKWMKEYDKGMCDDWRDEIEKLLIFAGLFAATVTPFAIDSYKWLQEDNAAASTKLLAQISLQLAAMANNSTQPSPAASLPDSSAFIPLSRSVRINTTWFLSLIMCLSTVILGILCLQWLREYRRESSLASFDAITVRQMRYKGLLYWKVPDLISFLPMALQASVLLFFGGILDLLWSLHPAVAAVATVAVGLVVAALVFTTFAPVVQSTWYFYRPILYGAMKQCPYKSPFSWLFLRLAMCVDRHGALFPDDSFSYGKLTSWDVFDVAWDEKQSLIPEGKDVYNVQGLANALDWTIKKLTPAGAQSDIVPEIFHSLHSDLPRPISRKTLLSWTTFRDNDDYKVIVAQGLDEREPLNRKVQYDLLMIWFLQSHQTIFNCDDLVMELRLRCLNTLVDRPMNEMFDEVLRNYRLMITSSDTEDASVGELRFQTMATILDYHKRHGGSGSPVILDHVDLIGQALAGYIRCTPVKNDNALMCYVIHKRLEGLLEDTRSSVQHRSTSIHDHTASIDRQSKIYNDLYPQIAALLLGRLDLRKVEEWEKNITKITGKQISVSGQLNSFLRQDLLPALDARDTLAPLAMQIRDQLVHIDPPVNHSDTVETEVDDGHGNKVRREALVT